MGGGAMSEQSDGSTTAEELGVAEELGAAEELGVSVLLELRQLITQTHWRAMSTMPTFMPLPACCIMASRRLLGKLKSSRRLVKDDSPPKTMWQAWVG